MTFNLLFYLAESSAALKGTGLSGGFALEGQGAGSDRWDVAEHELQIWGSFDRQQCIADSGTWDGTLGVDSSHPPVPDFHLFS